MTQTQPKDSTTGERERIARALYEATPMRENTPAKDDAWRAITWDELKVDGGSWAEARAERLSRAYRETDAILALRPSRMAASSEGVWSALKERCCAHKPDHPEFDNVKRVVMVSKEDLADAMLAARPDAGATRADDAQVRRTGAVAVPVSEERVEAAAREMARMSFEDECAPGGYMHLHSELMAQAANYIEDKWKYFSGDATRLLTAALAEPDKGVQGDQGALEACLSPSEQKVQAARCACRGADDWCPCQNTPDRTTMAARRAAVRGTPPESPYPLGPGHNCKSNGWDSFFAGKGREDCPFPLGRADLQAGYREGWDRAASAVRGE